MCPPCGSPSLRVAKGVCLICHGQTTDYHIIFIITEQHVV